MAKVKVRYTGHKKAMPVDFPIGCKSKGGVEETVMIDRDGVEMDEKDAQKLLELNTDREYADVLDSENKPTGEKKLVKETVRNFEIVGAKKAKSEEVGSTSQASEAAPPADDKPKAAPKAKAGKKAK